MPWQKIYSELRRAGEPVTGDKARWGSVTDKFAAKAEDVFQGLVPSAENMNKIQWQSKYDFALNGHKVDVKGATAKRSNKKTGARRFAFAFKKQIYTADFFVCFCFDDNKEVVVKTLLIPRDMIIDLQSLSVPESGKSKWLNFELDKSGLNDFFLSMPLAQ
jgi:hypothetical protein